jgi:hypothetical protein
VNQIGTVGGCVNPYDIYIGPASQAALFRGPDVELIPRLPNEVSSCVVAVNDTETALVVSSNAANDVTAFLYQHGRTNVVPLGVGVTLGPIVYQIPPVEPLLRLNDSETIAGTSGIDGGAPFAFRRDPLLGMTSVLSPLHGYPLTWGVDLNARGDVLGYSFVSSNTVENIGVWDALGVFHRYWTEGNAEYPTISNFLLFNEPGLIVITETTDLTSYLVPRPDVRWNLADLVGGLPTTAVSPHPLYTVSALNDQGMMCGWDYGDNGFVLVPVGFVDF